MDLHTKFTTDPDKFTAINYFTIILSMLLCACGLYLNLCLIYGLKRSGMRRQYIFNISISLSDSTVCVLKLLVHGVELYYGSQWGGNLQCQIQGYLQQALWSISVVCMTAIAWDPFRIVVQRKGPPSDRAVTIMLLVIWIGVGFFPATVPFWPIKETHQYVYHSSGLYCLSCYYCQEFWVSFLTKIEAFTLLVSPINVLILFNYICYKISILSPETEAGRLRAEHMQATVIRRCLFIVGLHVFSYWITFTTIVYENSTGHAIPFWADCFNYIVPLCSFSINPILCFYLEPRIRSPIRHWQHPQARYQDTTSLSLK
ncbi:hypothetical protein HK103_007391 [Boothiomyces macroporosus]|uniref:G-protein coupled receptors family 1 profile domain-containing protein n=1 Tax=Boothiomyces macroporosus TaxID=261099 RepID=A0AAD5YAD0_9FUNG|nr:hypothetical protein HK103_007391 [Boothiomyces macroporosus]